MGDWVTTILSAIGSMFTTMYDSENTVLAYCMLIPVVGGIAAFCTRLAKRSR